MSVTTTRQPQIGNGGSLVPTTITEAMQVATMMSKARMVPKHLQDDPGSCFMVVEQAQRWNMSPFAVAQCTSNIGGKLCYEGKLIAAVVMSCGGITGEFDYEFTGDPSKPETLSVTASAVRSSDGQRKHIVLAWKDAKTENKYWRIQPEQQLCYAASRVWARRWTPGPLLGVYAPEEMGDVSSRDYTGGPTITATAEPASPSPVAAPVRTRKMFLDELEAEIAAVHTDLELRAIRNRDDVAKAFDTFSNGAFVRLDDMFNAALARVTDGSEAGAYDEVAA